MKNRPLLLHGFLGCKEDWAPFCQYFDGLPIDWRSERDILCYSGRPVIGYSLGGRLALKLRRYFPRIILVSANLGIDIDREARRIQDEDWAQKLETLPLMHFLKQWYGQPLFNTLRLHPAFPEMLERRMKVNPKDAAAMLRRYSLADQPSYTVFDDQVFFVYGSEDTNCAKQYRSLPRSFEIPHCGHAIHLEQPRLLARISHQVMENLSDLSRHLS